MTSNKSPIPDSFVNQVKDALENIYDYPALQTHPFAIQLSQQNPKSPDNPAHQVRRLLIDAIEKLNPGNHEGARTGTKRIYNLLHLHYVGGMTLQEVALELGVSVRQAYRDLKKGLDSVSSVLWFKIGEENNAVADEQTMDTLSSVESEVTQVESNIQWMNLTYVLQSISSALHPLIKQHNVTIELDLPDEAYISTNPTIARQVLMSLLSQAIQQNLAQVTLQLEETEKRLLFYMRYGVTMDSQILAPVVEKLLQQLKWHIEQTATYTCITIPLVDTTVLLIDDNKGLVDLMKRYLGDKSYQVITAHNGYEGLQLAQDVIPDIIIMDIMMPEMDGWELLQRLRTFPATSETPIIVCSVINDSQLALSLGATKFVTKPVDKEKLFLALAELNL